MDGVLLLANSAEAAPNGLVHALGIGWTATVAPTPPAALIMLLQVPWDQTNTEHTFRISLVDADGSGVMLGQDPLTGQPVPLYIEGKFEVGRPPGVPHGTSIDQALSINIGPGMPLAPGSYQWRLQVNGEELAARGFRVQSPPQKPFGAPNP